MECILCKKQIGVDEEEYEEDVLIKEKTYRVKGHKSCVTNFISSVKAKQNQNNEENIGWCCKCKKKVEMRGGKEIKSKRGFMLRGNCPFCNTIVSRIMKKKEG